MNSLPREEDYGDRRALTSKDLCQKSHPSGNEKAEPVRGIAFRRGRTQWEPEKKVRLMGTLWKWITKNG